jgi:hypothetical protein
MVIGKLRASLLGVTNDKTQTEDNESTLGRYADIEVDMVFRRDGRQADIQLSVISDIVDWPGRETRSNGRNSNPI